MSKRHICKNKFHVLPFFLDIYENPKGNNFINPSYPKHPKIIEIRNGINFNFILPAVIKPFWGNKKKCENKKIMSFSPLIRDWDDKGEDCVFVEIPNNAISVSWPIETHKNRTWNIQTKLVC